MTHGTTDTAMRIPGLGRAFALLVSLTMIAAAMLSLAPTIVQAQDGECGVRPLDVVLIIDRSSSMNTSQSGQSRIAWARQAATGLVSGLNSNGGVGGDNLHRVGVVTFSDAAAQVLLLSGAADASEVNDAINGITASGFTAFKQGMAAGINNMGSGRTFHNGVAVTRVYVLLSDGNPNPNSNTPNATETSNYLNSADTAYAVAIGEDGGDLESSGGTGVSYSFMQSVSKPVSAFRAVTNAADLPQLFAGILDEITCPAINVEKSADPGQLPAGGGEVEYSYAVTNTVDGAPLADVTVTDDKCAPVVYVSGDTNLDGLLQHGETWWFTCSAVLTETTTNVATAQGSFDGKTFTDRDEATVTVADPEPSQPEPSQPEPSQPEPSQPEPSQAEPSEDTQGGNPTPEESDSNLPDTAVSGVEGGASTLPLTALALTFVGSLGALALVNQRSRRER